MLISLQLFQPLQLSYMQPKKEDQLFIFEDDEQIIQVPAPREKIHPQNQAQIEPVILDDQSENGSNLHQNYDQIISPNFNSLPSHLKKHQKDKDQGKPVEQQEHKPSDLVFLQQNAYSFRKNGLEPPKKVQYRQISNDMELISDFNSQMSKNQPVTQGKQQDTRGLSRKNDRRRNRSKFQDINDSSSVTSSKLAEKTQHFKEPQKMVPNFLTQVPNKEVEAEYHKTQDHLTHNKKDQEEIIQSITGISKGKRQDKVLPPIQPHKPGQIFINTSGILQNQTSMVALNKKQEVNRLQMTNMSSLSHMLNTNDNEKSKKIAQKIVPQSKSFKCTFQRQKICCLNYWHPQYSFNFKNEKLILNAKKQCGKINSRYNITSDQRIYDNDCDGFLGYLAGNFFGTCFNLYQKTDEKQQLVCTIAYETQLTCFSAFRKFEIYVKNEQCPSQSLYKGSKNQNYNLKQLYDMGQNAKQNKIFKLINKKPDWNDELGCYSLNFKGKCRMGSVKNTVLIAQNEPNRYILLFCKTDHNTFCTQISYPLSPFIAMGIVLSGFDFKLLCQ